MAFKALKNRIAGFSVLLKRLLFETDANSLFKSETNVDPNLSGQDVQELHSIRRKYRALYLLLLLLLLSPFAYMVTAFVQGHDTPGSWFYAKNSYTMFQNIVGYGFWTVIFFRISQIVLAYWVMGKYNAQYREYTNRVAARSSIELCSAAKEQLSRWFADHPVGKQESFDGKSLRAKAIRGFLPHVAGWLILLSLWVGPLVSVGMISSVGEFLGGAGIFIILAIIFVRLKFNDTNRRYVDKLYAMFSIKDQAAQFPQTYTFAELKNNEELVEELLQKVEDKETGKDPLPAVWDSYLCCKVGEWQTLSYNGGLSAFLQISNTSFNIDEVLQIVPKGTNVDFEGLEKIRLIAPELNAQYDVYGACQLATRVILKPANIERLMRDVSTQHLEYLTIENNKITAIYGGSNCWTPVAGSRTLRQKSFFSKQDTLLTVADFKLTLARRLQDTYDRSEKLLSLIN